LKQALPFVVEEELAGNIEDMHLVHGKPRQDGTIDVTLVDRKIMQYWCGQFADCNIPLTSCLSLPDVLVSADDSLKVVIGEDDVLVKGGCVCLQVETENAYDLVSMTMASSREGVIRNVELHFPSGRPRCEELVKRFEIELEAEDCSVKSLACSEASGMLDFLQTQGLFENGVNILTAEFASDGGVQPLVRYGMATAAGVIACILLQGLFNYAAGAYFNHRAEVSAQHGSELYLGIYPGERIISLGRQLDGKMQQSGVSSGPGFSEIFIDTARSIHSIGNNSELQMIQFRYDEKSNELRLDLDASSIAILDALKNDITGKGYQVDILSANEDGSVIKASLLVQTG
jgi:type II secretory pathway component PulL